MKSLMKLTVLKADFTYRTNEKAKICTIGHTTRRMFRSNSWELTPDFLEKLLCDSHNSFFLPVWLNSDVTVAYRALSISLCYQIWCVLFSKLFRLAGSFKLVLWHCVRCGSDAWRSSFSYLHSGDFSSLMAQVTEAILSGHRWYKVFRLFQLSAESISYTRERNFAVCFASGSCTSLLWW